MTLLLTGFMGTGKSTAAQIVADSTGLSFVDLDDEIERAEGLTITRLFAERGEHEFRRIEAAALERVLASRVEIVATGGGALVSAENRALLGDDDRVLCLTCSVDELRRRLSHASDRPLLRAPGAVESLLGQRAPIYGLYPQVDTTGRSPEQVAQEIVDVAGLSGLGTLEMERPQRSHILLERGSMARIGSILDAHGLRGDAFLVTDETIASLGYLEMVRGALERSGRRVVSTVLPAGEGEKTTATLDRLYRLCLGAGVDRSTIVIGLGGGVVCDLAGMLAATYLRGLRFVSVPTTLLAQVDAAIGGKVGVDFEGVKNIVGAFHPADVVLLDPACLETLPAALLSDGMAEIVKIALVRSAGLLEQVADLDGIEDVPGATSVIREAAATKVQVVRRDPYERGERMMLNFGHTIGHAIESAGDYCLSHGSAVSIGMAAEVALAVRLGICPPVVQARLLGLLQRFRLPVSVSALRPAVAASSGRGYVASPEGGEVHIERADVLGIIQHDKKRNSGGLRFALPTGFGAGEVITVADGDVRWTVDVALEGDG